MSRQTLRQQLRQHSVALISLVIALSSLGYNTWRNEQTEANRNVRTAGIALLLRLGELDQTVLFRHYDDDEVRGSPRTGWALVLTIKDLAALAGKPVMSSSENLFDVWQANWSGLGSDNEAEKRISAAIERLRTDMLEELAALD